VVGGGKGCLGLMWRIAVSCNDVMAFMSVG
jgi:hypothetical protein